MAFIIQSIGRLLVDFDRHILINEKVFVVTDWAKWILPVETDRLEIRLSDINVSHMMIQLVTKLACIE
ncbi:hypothetical protein ACFFLZ_04415 [Photobacterium aphoticum]|uniref:Uncharacterized protein n=1 Tax=Photobacterium aphoticum TaxID=754436 RepID=A0A0J1JIB5_9GAMM|nr:hypothetical protein [Photobacterium aphoticum]KLV01687.1 hypothetical protein ABT58_04320 [Photobacterium aphoticum]PSU59260.1 hypothetical protein C9I90_04085 [Photobacterium aphoticum]GHA31406.1 hypothetical protein GCM10007086_00640 [Photobacterium aphoticum]